MHMMEEDEGSGQRGSFMVWEIKMGRRNVLLNKYIIDTFVDAINGFVFIKLVGGHSFLWHGTPIFNCILCI